jgi:pyruvate dehydrogenase E1 component alpha subunit/2-oxoisovalerate dehydrogenase E1 component alpha subunit
MKRAVEHARGGNGSVLIEALTYRRKGHAEHDNQSYVPAGEIDFWANNNDPIDRYERFLKEEKIADENALRKIVTEVSDYLEAELEIAEQAGFPESVSAAYDVFDNSIVPPAFKKRVLEK